MLLAVQGLLAIYLGPPLSVVWLRCIDYSSPTQKKSLSSCFSANRYSIPICIRRSLMMGRITLCKQPMIYQFILFPALLRAVNAIPAFFIVLGAWIMIIMVCAIAWLIGLCSSYGAMVA